MVAIGFVTKLGKELLNNYRFAEVFIDSTFKTNSSKIELFTILVSVFGVGFPLACIFMGTSHDDTRRQEVVTNFLQAVKNHCSNLTPLFFFSDKDRGQLNAIRAVFNIVPSLCYWHMKNAVKKKIIRLRQRNECKVSEDEEKSLMKLITSHYNLHPSVSRTMTSEQIKSRAVSEINSFCSSARIAPLHDYMLKKW